MNKLRDVIIALLAILGGVNEYLNSKTKDEIVDASRYVVQQVVEARYQEAVDQECGAVRGWMLELIEVVNKLPDPKGEEG